MTRPAEPAPADPMDTLAQLGASWQWALGYAFATLIPGIIVLVWPEETLHILAVVIGLQFLVVGAFRFVTAFGSSDGAEGGGRLLRALIGMGAVLAGVLCMRHPLQTIAALSLIVGVVWLLSGLMSAYIAIAERGLPHRGVVFATGALGVVAGIVVLGYPVESAVALARLLGLWLVLLGVAEMALALLMRGRQKRTATS